MRTKLVIIEEKDAGDSMPNATYANDPEYELGSKTKVDKWEVVPSETMEECGCCGAYHRKSWFGDCREDDERFYTID